MQVPHANIHWLVFNSLEGS